MEYLGRSGAGAGPHRRGAARRRGRSRRGGAAAGRRRAAADARGARQGRVGQDHAARRAGARRWSPPGVEPVSTDYESRKTPHAADAGGAGADQQGGERAARPRRAGDDDPPHPLHPALPSRLRGDRRVADRQGRAAEGRGADRGGARPGDGLLSPASVDPRRAGQRRAARLGLHQGLEAARRAARHRADRRGLDARRAAVCRPAGRCSARWCCSATRRSWRRSAAAAAWCSTRCRTAAKLELSRVHRQAADSPILDLAARARRPGARLRGLRAAGRDAAAARDPRVVVSAARRCRGDGAGAGAGLAERDAGAADPRLPRSPTARRRTRCCRASR